MLTDRWALAHINIAVPNLEEAIERYSAAWGLTWTPIVDLSGFDVVSPLLGVPVSTDGLREAWSLQDPRIELSAAPSGPIWGTPDAREYVHHVGYWVDDLEAESAALVANGWGCELTMAPGDPPTGMAYHLSPAGMRIEIRPLKDKEMLDRAAAGEGPLDLNWPRRA